MTRDREVEILKTCVEDAERVLHVEGSSPAQCVGGHAAMAEVLTTLLYTERINREYDKEDKEERE